MPTAVRLPKGPNPLDVLVAGVDVVVQHAAASDASPRDEQPTFQNQNDSSGEGMPARPGRSAAAGRAEGELAAEGETAQGDDRRPMVVQHAAACDASRRDEQRPAFQNQNDSSGEGMPAIPGRSAAAGRVEGETAEGDDRRPMVVQHAAAAASDASPRDEQRPAFQIDLAGEGVPARPVSPDEEADVEMAAIFGEEKPAPDKKRKRQRVSEESKACVSML